MVQEVAPRRGHTATDPFGTPRISDNRSRHPTSPRRRSSSISPKARSRSRVRWGGSSRPKPRRRWQLRSRLVRMRFLQPLGLAHR